MTPKQIYKKDIEMFGRENHGYFVLGMALLTVAVLGSFIIFILSIFHVN